MIKIEHIETYGWEAAIRGMRNPLNSWDKSDSFPAVNCEKCGRIEREGMCTAKGRDCTGFECFYVGNADLKLMQNLIKAGPDHGKFMRMIGISMDIVAPLYWWKEYDTYKVGTVANSCSTMHKIAAKTFEIADFSNEHLVDSSMCCLEDTIERLNFWRTNFIVQSNPETADKDAMSAKDCWWQIIQLLPSSYDQRRTVTLNYAVARNQYHARKAHKLTEWHDYCKALEGLPYAELITMEGRQHD